MKHHQSQLLITTVVSKGNQVITNKFSLMTILFKTSHIRTYNYVHTMYVDIQYFINKGITLLHHF